MKRYTDAYNANDLFDMFANQADPKDLVYQDTGELALQLNELAPEMADSADVALSIQGIAGRKLTT